MSEQSTSADTCAKTSPIFSSPSRLKLGTFHVNCTRGGTPSMGEGTIDELNWAQQVRIAQLTEEAGMEAIIPIARWRGYEGPSGFNREQYEAMTWAAGIGMATERISIFSTAHVPLNHPVRVAKEGATIDHITGGRFCLNIVAGWNEPEMNMFGVSQVPHDERYEVAGEWATIVKRLWTSDEEQDLGGKYYQGTRAISRPHPIQKPRPPIMSAGSSPAGCNFAATHADICFVGANTPEELAQRTRETKQMAADKGREVAVWAQVGFICGDSDADVQRLYDYFVHETGDWDAAEFQMGLLMAGDSQTIDFKPERGILERMIAMQHAYQMYGTPERIVEQMEAISAAGIDGLSVVMFDFERGLKELRDEILPLAAKSGVRAAGR